MTETERSRPPKTKKFSNIELPEIREIIFGNNIPVYVIHADDQDIIRIDLVFDAGLWYQPAPLVSSFTNLMLTEGTGNFSSAQIAEMIDYYGAFINQEFNNDTSSVTLLSLNKHLPDTIKILDEIVKRPVFPDNELNTLRNKKKQTFEVENSKVKVLAQKKFQTVLFGESHPYGNKVMLNDFDVIDRNQLEDFFHCQYTPGNIRIILSGNADKKVISLLDTYLGKNNWKYEKKDNDSKVLMTNNEHKKYFIEKKDAVQSAIRIGCLTIDKHHADYPGMMILNTLLGGYFGSRLMSNIREEKGYTYGIGSAIISLRHSSYFFIATEVASEVCKDATREIYHELRKLREEPVPETELDRVRNYMMGEMLREFDGPFEQADTFRSLLDLGLDYQFYNKLTSGIWNISPKELNILAEKYLREESMIEITAGKKYS